MRFFKRRRRYIRRVRKRGRGIPKISQGKIYFGRGQRGRGGLSKFAAKLIASFGDVIGI